MSSGKGTSIVLDFDSNLRSSLAHLPPSIHNALLSRDIPPQSIVLQVSRNQSTSKDQDQQSDSDEDDEDTPSRESSECRRDSIYLGWSGQSSNIDSTLTLSSSLADLFHPRADPSSSSSSYTLTLLRSPPLPTATRVDLTPLTPDDWELLSQNAGAVEDNMLSQVRGVNRGGRVCIFVGPNRSQHCWFRVDSTEPQTSNRRVSKKSLPRAVRLGTDTEVVIAPRTRQSQAETLAKEQHAINGNKPSSATSSVNSKLAARTALKHRIFKVLPVETRPAMDGDDDTDLDGDTPIAIIGIDQGELEWSLLSTAFGNNISASASEWLKATIHIQSCPSAPSIRPLDCHAPNASQATAANHSPTSTAYLVRSPTTKSSRWIWFNAALRNKLGGRVGVGETVCFSAPPPGSDTTKPPPVRDISTSSNTSPQTLPTTPSIAGVTTLLSSLESHIRTSISSHSLHSSDTSSNILLYGSSGTGKTSILKVLSSRLSSTRTIIPLYIDCTSLSELRISQLKTTFQEWRDALDWYAQGTGRHSSIATVLLLDNLDRVLIPEVENVDPSRARTIAELFIQYVSPQAASKNGGLTMVMGTANSSTSLHKLLVEKHFWNETLAIKSPGKAERSEILAHLVKVKVEQSKLAMKEDHNGKEREATLEADPSLNYIQLSSQTEGYLPADLVDLVDRAIYRAAVRASDTLPSKSSSLKITYGDFQSAQENFTPLSLRSLSLSSSTISWSSIGGLQETRRVLRETLEFPSRYAQIFASCPLRLRSGLLLYGYPGCGKTMLASAVAKECGANFVSVKGPEILNKYIGASEKSIRDLFERASAAKPCVLFFDEFDSIAPKRGHDSTGVTDRVVNQLLTQMDGAEGLDGVYVLAATSRPDLIDSALLRPGRLDKSLLCDMPSEADRVEILEAVVRSGKMQIHEEVKWKEWTSRLEGFSGADLQAFIYNAHLEVVYQGIANVQSQQSQGSEKETTKSGSKLRFVEIKPRTESDSSAKETIRSGAETQALQRRIELALQNSRPSPIITTTTTSKQLPTTTKQVHTITNAHLEKSLSSMRPSVPLSERMRLNSIYREFSGDNSRSTEFKNGDDVSRAVGARESLM
ncbi:unnamed protein product [Sympodiomycopsis kandeliae]